MAKSQKKKAKYFGDVKDAILSPKEPQLPFPCT